MSTITDTNEFLTDLNAGAFEQMFGAVLSDVGLAVVSQDGSKKGKVTLEFEISKVSNANVTIDHKISFVKPTNNGKATEEHKTTTPMHVNRGGRMTFFPENQTQMFTKSGEIASEKG